MRDLCEAAVDAALGAGASYADARAVVRRVARRSDEERPRRDVSDVESEGIGVRVLVDGAWGFAGDRPPRRRRRRDAALRACEFARAAPGRHRDARSRRSRRTAARYRTPVERDPFAVPLTEKIDLCLRAEEGMRHADVKVTRGVRRAPSASTRCSSPPRAPRSSRRSSSAAAGSTRSPPPTTCSQIRSYPSAHGGRQRQGGWEFVEDLGLDREAPRVGEQAAALLRAASARAGETTVVLAPEQVELQVHESVGHPTELDRVYGTEAATRARASSRPTTSARFATARSR